MGEPFLNFLSKIIDSISITYSSHASPQLLNLGLSKPRCTRKYEKILERLGRLRERYALVNHHYDITVTKAPDGKARVVTWKRNAAYDTRDARTGHCVLRTSHTEWSVEDTVRTYWA